MQNQTYSARRANSPLGKHILVKKTGPLWEPVRHLVAAALIFAAAIALPASTYAKDKLLDEVTDFTGSVLFLETKVPALMLGLVRNGQTSVAGFGKITADADRPPDATALLRIGSITKVFTGAVLASLVAGAEANPSPPLLLPRPVDEPALHEQKQQI
jgi:hypothetical protein